MPSRYPKQWLLPSLFVAVWLGGCDSAPPPERRAERPSNVYSEALQEAKAAQQHADQRQLEQQRIDALLDRDGR